MYNEVLYSLLTAYDGPPESPYPLRGSHYQFRHLGTTLAFGNTRACQHTATPLQVDVGVRGDTLQSHSPRTRKCPVIARRQAHTQTFMQAPAAYLAAL